MNFREVVEQAVQDGLGPLDVDRSFDFVGNLICSLAEALDVPEKAQPFVATLKIIDVDIGLGSDHASDELNISDEEELQNFLSDLENKLVPCEQLKSQAEGNETLASLAEIISTHCFAQIEVIKQQIQHILSSPKEFLISTDGLDELYSDEEHPECSEENC